MTTDVRTGRAWPDPAGDAPGLVDPALSAPPVFVFVGSEAPDPPVPFATPNQGRVTALTPVVRTGAEFVATAERFGMAPEEETPLESGPWMSAAGPDGELTASPTGTATLNLRASSDRVPTEILDSNSAVELARSVVGDLGLGPDAVDWLPEQQADVQDWRITGTLAGVEEEDRAPTWEVLFSPGAGPEGWVVRVRGPLVTVDDLGERPVIDAVAAVERLNDPRVGAATSALPPLFPDRTNAFRAHRDAGVEESLLWAPPTIELRDPILRGGQYLSPDGVTYLVPVFQFSTDGIRPVEVIALDDETLGLD